MRVICSWCLREKIDSNNWINSYRPQNQDYTHGICPECTRKHFSCISEKVLEKSNKKKKV